MQRRYARVRLLCCTLFSLSLRSYSEVLLLLCLVEHIQAGNETLALAYYKSFLSRQSYYCRVLLPRYW